LLAAFIAAAGTWVASASIASACGCFSPPILPPDLPDVTADQYAVAQQAEQIIFEVEDGVVTAHVLIRYEGKPETFAWLLPVPTEPALDLSESMAFAILDAETSPEVTVQERDLCPVPNYRCEYHPSPRCGSSGGGGGGCGFSSESSSAPGASDSGTIVGDGAPGGMEPPVEVISRQVIGAYDTVVFAAGDAMAAVTWLQDEGFIVNDTTTPYMQPYLDAGMLFVASRLIAGAGIEEIRPLKLTYAADAPMIPLQLTAVSAEPHLTVNAFIFGATSFRPLDQPLTEIDETLLSTDPDGRGNYPMVLARVIDEAGGDAFVAEYNGVPPISSLGRDPCCQGSFDSCRVRGDGLCQCPGSEFDATDCEDIEGLEEGLLLVEELAARHGRMTRLSTRLSPEEMTFDPAFVPDGGEVSLTGRLSAAGQRSTLDRCRTNVVDVAAFDEVRDRQSCAATYCGAESECAITASGGGCVCGPGMVARAFTDADGQRSVTCVSEVPLVDFSAGGVVLPSACATVDCGFGTCVDLGGFPACQCNPGQAAVVVMGVEAPRCVLATQMAASPGAEDFTGPLEEVAVCAPAPPSCGERGWLVETSGGIRGEACPSSVPDPAAFEIPPMQTCADLGRPGRAGGGGGCSAALKSTPMHLPVGAGLLIVALGRVFVRRRRRR